jgi:cytochrome b561
VAATPAHGLTRTRYSGGAIALHWATVVLIIIGGTLGLLHDSWPKATQAFWINVHALVGLTILALAALRVIWRIFHRPPPPPMSDPPVARLAAHAVHYALYGLIFILAGFGIVTFIWHGRSLNLGLVQIGFGVKSDRAVFHSTEIIHGYLAYALFALAGVHALAALTRQFVLRDNTLLRMWPAGNHP